MSQDLSSLKPGDKAVISIKDKDENENLYSATVISVPAETPETCVVSIDGFGEVKTAEAYSGTADADLQIVE